MSSNLVIKGHGILLEPSLWILLAIRAIGGFGFGAAPGRWTVGAAAGGALGSAVGIAVSFVGAVPFVAPVHFIRDIRRSVRVLEEAGSGGNAA